MYQKRLASWYQQVVPAKSFASLPEEVQSDLQAWYNQVELDPADKQRLFRLYMSGRFQAWDCPLCATERVYHGEPTSWTEFQGTQNQDFSSYPGNAERYTPECLEAMCDSCRTKSWRD